jgi:hypothetical protein
VSSRDAAQRPAPDFADSSLTGFTPLAGPGSPDRAGVTGTFTGSPDHFAVALAA